MGAMRSPQQHWLKRLDLAFDPVFNPGDYIAELAQEHFQPLTSSLLESMAQEHFHTFQKAFKSQHAYQGFAGDHRTFFRGQGLDFCDLREYNPGDDIRKLDWQVFARTQIPHIREYHEERELRIWIALERSLALKLGPGKFISENSAQPICDKLLRALEVATTLSRLAQDINARFALIDLNAEGQTLIPMGKGHSQHIRIRTALLENSAINAKSHDDFQPLVSLQKLVLKQDWLVVLADATRMNQSWAMPLCNIAQRANVSVFGVYNPEEATLPNALQGKALISPALNRKDVIEKRVKEQTESGYENNVKRMMEKIQGLRAVVPLSTEARVDQALCQWLGGVYRQGQPVLKNSLGNKR